MKAVDDETMVALRMGATLAHALPTVRLRIRAEGRVVLDVHRPPFPDGERATPAIPPCGFRRAVAAAHQRRAAGEELSFLGLPAGCAPAIDVGLAPGDRALPGDLYRVTLGADWLHVFATTLSADRCKAADDGALVRVGFHRDEATEITLVHVASPVGAIVLARRALDVLEGVYGRCAVAELEAHLIAVS